MMNSEWRKRTTSAIQARRILDRACAQSLCCKDLRRAQARQARYPATIITRKRAGCVLARIGAYTRTYECSGNHRACRACCAGAPNSKRCVGSCSIARDCIRLGTPGRNVWNRSAGTTARIERLSFRCPVLLEAFWRTGHGWRTARTGRLWDAIAAVGTRTTPPLLGPNTGQPCATWA